MNRYIKVLIGIAALYAAGIILFAVVSSGMTDTDPTTESVIIAMNDISRTAEENWPELKSLEEKTVPTGYAIINPEGERLYTSGEFPEGRVTVETAIKNSYPYKYIIVDGQVTGTVIMYDNVGRIYDRLRIKILIAMAAAGALFLLALIGYGIYVNSRIIQPFKRMKEFAGKIAEGNLDEPLAMDKNNLFGAFTESFDIMREELSESKKRELALQKKERELVASLSHDLKTPITGIKLTTELLKAKQEVKKDEADPDTMEKLDNIYMKADQIDVLVSDLFTSTLDDLGEFKVNCRDEESGVLAGIIKKYDDKGLVVSACIPEVIINIDTRRMSQVIGNIISNSYKYAGTGINIAYELSEGFLEMSISDFGPGVPQDELNLITNKFYRGKSWVESGEEGNGLGLYISKMLMEKMNGELIPESRDDGFTVRLLIPLS